MVFFGPQGSPSYITVEPLSLGSYHDTRYSPVSN